MAEVIVVVGVDFDNVLTLGLLHARAVVKWTLIHREHFAMQTVRSGDFSLHIGLQPILASR
jgi:hypothetical protein